MRKPKFPTLNAKIVIASNTDNLFSGYFGEPDVGITECSFVILLETAEISAMDQNIALGNR